MGSGPRGRSLPRPEWPTSGPGPRARQGGLRPRGPEGRCPWPGRGGSPGRRRCPAGAQAELLDQPDVPEDQPGLRGDIVYQLPLRRVHRFVDGHGEGDRAQGLALVAHRDRVAHGQLVPGHAHACDRRRLRRMRDRWHEPVPDPEPHPHLARARALPHETRHPGEDVVDGVGLREAVGELRQHLVRRGAFPVHEPSGRSPPSPAPPAPARLRPPLMVAPSTRPCSHGIVPERRGPGMAAGQPPGRASPGWRGCPRPGPEWGRW